MTPAWETPELAALSERLRLQDARWEQLAEGLAESDRHRLRRWLAAREIEDRDGEAPQVEAFLSQQTDGWIARQVDQRYPGGLDAFIRRERSV